MGFRVGIMYHSYGKLYFLNEQINPEKTKELLAVIIVICV